MEKLTVGKWIFLWVVLAEGISLGLAMVMRSMGELHGRWGPSTGQGKTPWIHS